MRNRFITKLLRWKQEFTYQLRTTAHRLFPRYIKRPFPREDLSEIRKADPAANARTTPPRDEFIDLCGVWSVEFYTPSHMDDLVTCFKTLGWGEADNSRNPVNWLRDGGMHQFGQGWVSLGPIYPRDDPTLRRPQPFKAELPECVEYANCDMYRFSSSLIAVVFGFVFKEDFNSVFDKVLRQDRVSYTSRIQSGYRIHTPENQKTDHIYQIRRDVANMASDWISHNIPGMFSTGVLEGEFPTCEFVTVRMAKPFALQTELESSGRPAYLWHLGLDRDIYAWQSTSTPNLRFDPSIDDRAMTPRYHSILSANEGSWIEQHRDDFGGRDRWSRINGLHRQMCGLFGIRAILPLLEGYIRHFAELRNSGLISSEQRVDADETLQMISESVSYSVDIVAVTSELASYGQRERSIGFRVEEFTPCWRELYRNPEINLEQIIQENIAENATWVQSVDKVVRDHLTQYGTMLGMREDIHLQKKITRLTYAMLFLTLVLAGLTIFTALENWY